MNYFYPYTVLTNDVTGTEWQLTLTSKGKLGLMDRYGNVRPLVRADNYTVFDRTPVSGRFMDLFLSAWLQFAHQNGDSLNSGGLSVLEDIEEVLRMARLIDENGQPRKEMTLPAGAGGMVPEKDSEE